MPTSVVEAVDSLDEATDWEPIFNNGDRGSASRRKSRPVAHGPRSLLSASARCWARQACWPTTAMAPWPTDRRRLWAGSMRSDACQEPDFSLLTWTWRERCTTEEVGGAYGAGGNLVLANCRLG